MNRFLALAGISLSVVSFNLFALEGDAQAGEKAAAVCVACHQVDGGGMHVQGGKSWPRLAGQNAAYLYKQLQDLKSGSRQSATMAPFANMLSEQQAKDVAVYYSQLPATKGQGGEKATAEQLALGEKLALRGEWDKYIVPCKSCHGPDNQGAGEHFPAIAGQHAGYIVQELKAWQAKTRNNDPQHLMGAIAERMSDQEIQAVALWLSRQNAK